MRAPPPLSGSHPLVGWLNKLRRAVEASRITSFQGGRLQVGEGGTQLFVGPFGAGIVSAHFAFRQNYGDYISGVLVSNIGTVDEVESETVTYIAKPPEMRETGSETIGGVTYTYTTPYNYSDQSRAATDGTNSYDQFIVPRYILDETETPTKTRLVFAVRAGRTGVFVSGVECVWQEVSNRAWAREYTPPS